MTNPNYDFIDDKFEEYPNFRKLKQYQPETYSKLKASLIKEFEERTYKVTRLEIIDEKGREVIFWDDKKQARLVYQDDGRTSKIFVEPRLHTLKEDK